MDLRTWFRSVVGLDRPAALTVTPTVHDGHWWPQDGGTVRLDSSSGGAPISNGLTSLGSAFDKGTSGRPNPLVIPLDLGELRVLYAFNGLSRRIVDLLPARACRRGWAVPDLEGEDARLRVPERVEEAMKWARLYGGAVLVPVTVDDVPPEFRRNPAEWLRQPLDLERVRSVSAVHCFDAIEATPLRWDTDPASPTFRLPASWRISAQGYQVELHASRVIHFRGARRPPSAVRGGWASPTILPDDSVLQVLWEEVRHLAEIGNAGATLAQELRTAVLSLSGLAERSTSDDAGALDTQLRLMMEMRSLIHLNVIGTDDKYESQSNAPTGFKDLSDAAWEALSAATGIPQTILRGDAPSGLGSNGEASQEGFRQLVSAYQESHRHDLEGLYGIVAAAQDGPTRGAGIEDRTLVFAPLDEPSETVKADVRLKTAQTDAILVSNGIVRPADVTRSRYGAEGWSQELLPVQPLTPEELAARQPPAPTVQPGGTNAAPATGAPPDPATPPRADAADDSCVVLIPAADPGLRARVEAAIGQSLTVEDDPHVAVLYLGRGLSEEAVAEVVEAVGEAVEMLDPTALLECPTLRAFPPGPDGVPVVLEYGDAYAVACLNECLLRALAHVVTARQFARYRPHLSLGYAEAPLSPEAQAALLGIDLTVDDGGDASALRLRVPVGQVEVRVGSRVLLVAYPGQPAPETPETPAPDGYRRVRGHLRRVPGPNVPPEEEPA